MRDLFTLLPFAWSLLRRYRLQLLAGVVLSAIFGLSNGAFVWATQTILERLSPPSAHVTAKPKAAELKSFAETKKITDEIVDPWLPKLGRPVDWKQMAGAVLILPLIVAFRGLARYLSSYFMLGVSERVTTDLRETVLVKLNSLSLDYFNRSTMGDLITRVNNDTMALNRCLTSGLADLVREPMTMLGVFIALWLIDPTLALIGTVFLPLCFIPLFMLGNKARQAARSGGKANISQRSLLFETLQGVRVVKAFQLEEQQISRFRELSGTILHASMKASRARELIGPIVEVICMLGFGFLILYIFSTHTTIPDLVGFLMGMIIFYAPVKRLASLHILLQETQFGLNRLRRILDEKPTVVELPDAARLAKFSSAIHFQNVSFAYGKHMVLEEIDLTVPRGMKLGLAGESGSGKSTLINLIPRFYDPVSGKITIDGIDLKEISVADLRQLMALVSQEVVVFNRSVADNIACGKIGASRDEIEEAAKAAAAHNFIMNMPEQYDTLLGPQGVKLSGGQRQRISIARAFVRNAPILLLDEATASLDSRAEAEVQAAIDRLTQNRTVICVAHRLSTLASTDLILVLKEGRIVEQGDIDSLLRAEGPFASMAKRQGITSDTLELCHES
jgi:ATP-binding cassette, subfamily B, bacterial MsbA